MKKTQERRYMHNGAALAALLIIAATSMPALAHDERAAPFTMAVILGEAHGSKVEAGQYEQAIERITESGRRAPEDFADQVNLCVAYVKTKDIRKAGTACDAAVAKVKKQENRVSRIRNNRSEVRTYRANLALALSNRGVLLAATGDTERAKQDFLAAIDLQTQDSWIFENNLSRVEQVTDS
jgi:tetratricopeptide (TPR) repeat protein